MSATPAASSISFRDPDGTLHRRGDRLLRVVHSHAAGDFEDVLARRSVAQLIEGGRVVRTWRASPAELGVTETRQGSVVYEHERIPFVSYPAEWCPSMLARAGEFTLELALELLEDGLLLKDATPANVLFQGTTPVFVDVASIVPRKGGHFLWHAKHQYQSCFLLPLIAHAELGIPIAWSLQDPVAGLSHQRVARMIGLRRWLLPRLARAVALPALLSRAESTAARASAVKGRMANDAQAKFTLERTLRGLLRQTRRFVRRPRPERSHWSGYVGARAHYSEAELGTKRAFVETGLRAVEPNWVLDIGANTGEFSAAAARRSRVVALEVDEASADAIFVNASANALDIQPLVLDFARPTPAAGWQNAEASAFIERSRGRFDLVLMLAVMHHLRVTSGIPLQRMLAAVAAVTRRALIIEYVPPTDPMFARIARGREPLYADCTPDRFEVLLGRMFQIDEKQPLGNGRVMYRATRRSPAAID